MVRARHSRLATLKSIGIGALVAGVVVALAGCGGGGTSSSIAPQNPDTLTIAVSTGPNTLDPALAGNGDPLGIYYELAYEPLINLMPDGSYEPGLATEWGYTDDENKVFELTLREGVKFSDGSDLTAEAVKAHFEYYATAGGLFASRAQNFESIEVTGPLSVRINLKTPNPILPFWFSAGLVTGDIISPAGLADPAALGTSTFGAGQYVLDNDQTVTNQKYVYTPNPNYWNPDAVQWKEVTILVLASPAAQLSAMKAGQVDYMFGTSKEADAAKDAGFVVNTSPYLFSFVNILDHDGEKTPALGDERVRQAMIYALDREAIVSGLLGDYGSVLTQFSLPGFDAYDEDLQSEYPYDPEKAKELLAEAGYPDGFQLKMGAFNLNPGATDLAQALASEWAKVGIDVEISVPTTINDWAGQTLGFEFGANVFQFAAQPMYSPASQILAPEGGFFNPFVNNDPEIVALVEAGAAASAEDAPGIYQELNALLVEKAWLLPIAAVNKVVISRPGLEGVEFGGTYLDANPVLFTAAG
jgi:ABC-type transport system substrate-binding protein